MEEIRGGETITIIYEGRAKVEYVKENDAIYISGKKGIIMRIEGLKIDADLKDITMLDITVEGAKTTVLGGPSVVNPQ